MRLFTKQFAVVLLALSASISCFAVHQVGGQLEMRAVGDVPGHYRILVTNYMESGPRADNQRGGRLGIFRKRDNFLMTQISLQEIGQRQSIIYANEYCANQRNLKFIVATFEADVQLDPATYADLQGYYVSYQTRNRNAGIDNINSPSQTGFTFYLEFPALQQNGQVFVNSSPHFGPINGEYICVGEPFIYPFGATDPDGDELRYSLVTPLDQRGTNQNSVSAGPYPDVRWLSSYGATNAIPGSPPFRIDPQTGQLSVTATQLGLFVFAVKVEEYRNGIKIGEVRRDFQFLVIECPPATTPDPAVQISNRPANLRNATICRGDSALLQATFNSNWNYQWRQDGINIPNATGASLAVRESGRYTVVVSLKTACSKTGNSQDVIINVLDNNAKLAVAGHLCATTGSVKLAVPGGSEVNYQWYRDNQPLAGQTTDSLHITQAGRYWTTLTHKTAGCVFRTDSMSIERSPAVQAVIRSASGSTRICPQDSLQLEGSGGIRYLWLKDNQMIQGATEARHFAKTAGSYVLTASDADGCEGVSTPFLLTQVPPITVVFDSIPAVCGPDNPVYTLVSSPQGGEFSGVGVVGNAFNPKQAGVGNHQLTYTAKAAPECANVTVSRTAVVAPIPTIQLDDITTYKGNTFELAPALTGDPDVFSWTPTTYLSDASVPNPSVVSIAGDITYTISIKNASGCEASDSIRITVLERVWIPDAFSPNGDGQNDVWTLAGIEAFPDAVVTIFNRWGEVIYLSDKGYSKPFDGTMNGTALPTGVYPFTLRTVPEQPVVRGRLMLIR
ncbi:gliding motility-associated C-terminal domain-containing protein [Spirosoma soli]|uniref:Gliding motility-associated C-terminal domain-containing protein n=1 Tax=Spirosoma soli TaxID=1770529 RepID=A0ABW5LWX5_9BACT